MPPPCWREHGAETFGERKAALVFSAVAAKDIAGILEILAPLAERIFFCPVDTPRAVAPRNSRACLPAGAPPHECHEVFADAFAAALALNMPVLVAGSLFLVGEARAFLTDAVFQPSSQ